MNIKIYKIIITFTLAVCISTPCFAGFFSKRKQCDVLLTQKTHPQSYWTEQYNKAKLNNDVLAGQYSLVHLIWFNLDGIVKSHALKINKRSLKLGLVQLIKVIEAVESKDLYLVDESEKLDESEGFRTRTLGLFNLESLARKITPLNEPRNMKRRVSTVLNKWLYDLFWITGGPLIFRMTKDALSEFRLKYALVFLEHYFDLVLKNKLSRLVPMGIEVDGFLIKILKSFSNKRHFMFRHQDLAVGRFIRPMLVASILYMVHFHPVQLARAAMVDKSRSVTEYMNDIEVNTHIIPTGKTIKVILEQSFSVLNTDPPEGRVFKKLKASASAFSMSVISSVEELNAELNKSNDADIIIIVAHGLPGKAFIQGKQFKSDLNKIDVVPLKDGVSVLYISCDFGDKNYDQSGEEMWVELSKRILAKTKNGITVASINPLHFQYDLPDAGASYDKNFLILINVIEGIRKGFSQVFNTEQARLLQDVLDARASDFYGKIGIRVFDSRTGQVIYFDGITD